MLYGPDNRPLDARTDQQREFDRRLRQQISDNGGQFLGRRFVDNLKGEMLRRPAKEDKTPGESFGGLF